MEPFKLIAGESSAAIAKPYNLNSFSPLTEYIRDVISYSIRNKVNVILGDPYTNYSQFLLMAYDIVLETGKDVLIKVNSDEVIRLNDLYYHLQKNMMPLYNTVPIGIMTKKGISASPVLLQTVKRNNKSILKEKIRDNFLSRSKIILCSDRLDEIELESYYQESKSIDVIYEFIQCPRLNVSTVGQYSHLLSDKNNAFLLIVNDPLNKNIKRLKEELSCIYVPLVADFLKNNLDLFNQSVYYFEDKIQKNKKITEIFDIDNLLFYKNNADKPEIICISNNVRMFNESYRSLMYFRNNPVSLPENIMRSVEALFKLCYYYMSSFLTPVDQKIPILLDNWTTANGIVVSSYLKKKLSSLNSNQVVYVYGCLNIHSHLYHIFNNCIQFGTNNGHYNLNKMYFLMKFIEENVDKNILVITSNAKEVCHLKDIIFRQFDRSDFSNVCISDCYTVFYNLRKFIDFNPDRVLISGLISSDMRSLYTRFQNTAILAYESYERNCIEDQLKMMDHYYIDQINFYNECVSEIENLFEKNNTSLKLDLSKVDGIKIIRDDISDQGVQQLQPWSNSKNSVSLGILNSSENFDHGESLVVSLVKLASGEKRDCILYSKIKYLIYDEKYEDSLKEMYLGSDCLNKYIILVNTDCKSSLIDILSKIYGVDEDVDYELISMWKDETTLEEDSVSDYYQLYSDLGGTIGKQQFKNWLDGTVIAPQKIEDLYLLGEVFESDVIIENAEYIFNEATKLRVKRRLLGRHVKRVVSEIVNGEYQNYDLEYERIRDIVSDSLFQIRSINRSQ